YGDGIGPEIMEATLRIIEAAGASIAPEVIEIGESVYKRGNSSGIEPEAWESLRRTKVFLKAPITTPQGGGVKSLNVTVRKTLGLYANVRPVRSFFPFVRTKHPQMDVIIIRENEEDLYAGIEHRQTDEVYQCLKLISRPGSERIIRFAYEFAHSRERKKLTVMTKDNIMKLTDGLFHSIFDEMAPEYPEITTEHMIIDIGMAKMADYPEFFDVVVLPNLYGDILSDIVAEMSGSVGLAGSANYGEEHAMFEAIHGSAPDIAGQGVANPSGLLRGAVMMLAHIGQSDVAEKVYNAWLKTIEEGIHTADIYNPNRSGQQVGTADFTKAIIERLGTEPEQLKAIHYLMDHESIRQYQRRPAAKKELMGVDVFVHERDKNPEALANRLNEASFEAFKLVMISNRG
ncbi:MAG: NADP-dependent isocitrate dehydrogenase, partial [Holophagales bacterium]|nr:NADP-dependent isocitrate dehydrogenase [Holophagales bacterium]